MAEGGCYTVDFRPDEQRTRLVRGCGHGEALLPLEILTAARAKALLIPTRLSLIPEPFLTEYDGKPVSSGIEKSVVALYKGAGIIIPNVDTKERVALDDYRERCWPGLRIQAEEYTQLLVAGVELGIQEFIREQRKLKRDYFYS
ncbi:hypothetical protein J4218_04295 [Candidatus Pacearchaeota archaeon]|nr:hypothetical protein [Candidatus Pacearchaeota archaeon]